VGHLATVAREGRVPALFGLAGAVGRLRPDQVVTVDASRRVVFDGRVEGVLEETPAANPIAGSAVHRALAGVSELIVPLNLLDPEAPGFKPANCETLHDITRFCHEMSVREMFRFGEDNRFPEKSSRQLKYEVPMQFWIIDLADGLDESEPDPKYVLFDNIVSIPMLAIWRGMNAMEWEGPPRVDARGFMDLVTQSATNPWLSPAVPSAFSVKNYFMISKIFCSMQSRFGYHLAGVEALVGPRATENYVAFQFASGGTGPERQARRAQLIAEILLEHRFRAEAVSDSVRARIEGFGQEFMEQRLAVLGFLMIHTRQLDMAMVSDAAIASYKQKLLGQIEELGLATD
jgi:pyruvate,water dikinase